MDDPTRILSYANPIGDQPAGSTFVVNEFEDGIELTKPLRPDWVRAIAFGLVSGMILAVVVAVIIRTLLDRPRDRDPIGLLLPVLGLLAVVAGHMLWYVASICRQRTLTITLRGGRLTVRHAIWTLTGSTWTLRPRRVVTSFSGVDVGGLRILSNVIARRRLGLGRAFLHHLPRDECLWITNLLNNALNASAR